jgi:hypothetical protein
MNTIELKEGFYVQDWTGEIKKVKYFKKGLEKYGNIEEHTFVINDKDAIFAVLAKNADDKVFESSKDAINHSKDKIKKNIEYCQKQVKEYQERIEELKKKL